MEQSRNQRKRFFANRLHRQVFFLFLAVVLVPVLVTTILNYCLLLDITAKLANPFDKSGDLSYMLDKSILTLMIFTPVFTAMIVFLAHSLAQRIVGPFERIIREIDDFLSGTAGGQIHIRKGDKFQPLVDRINSLMEKAKNKS